MPTFIVTTPLGGEVEVESESEANAIATVRAAQSAAPFARIEASDPGERPSLEKFVASYPTERGFGRALTRGVSRGFSRMGSTFTDVIPAMLAAGINEDEYAKQQMEEAAAKEIELQRLNRPQFPSISDVKGPGDFLPFLGETIGEQGANLATSIGAGGIGSLIGRTAARRAAQSQLDDLVAAQVARKTAEARAKALPTSVPIRQEAAEAAVARRAPGFLGAAGARGAERGAVAGAFGASAGLNAPEIFQNIYQNTGELAPAASIIGGAFAGALDSILPIQVLKAFKSSPKSFQSEVIKKIGERKGLNSLVADYSAKTALGIGKAAVTEGTTEGMQEAISIAAEQFVEEGEQYWGSEEFDRILEASVRGAVGGGPFGAITGVSDAAKTRGIEAAEFARRAPPPELGPGAPVTGEEIDETLPPTIDAGPIAERSALTPVPVPPPVGGGLGSTDVPPILPGLNEEVAPEVRDVELTAEDFVELGRQGEEQSNLQETELEGAEDAATVADQDIEEEKIKAAAKGKPAPGEPAPAEPAPGEPVVTRNAPPTDPNTSWIPKVTLDYGNYTIENDPARGGDPVYELKTPTEFAPGVKLESIGLGKDKKFGTVVTLVVRNDKDQRAEVSVDAYGIDVNSLSNLSSLRFRTQDSAPAPALLYKIFGKELLDRLKAAAPEMQSRIVFEAVKDRFGLANPDRFTEEYNRMRLGEPIGTAPPATTEAPAPAFVLQTPPPVPTKLTTVEEPASKMPIPPVFRDNKTVPQLLEAIEEDKNAYSAIERLANRSTALDQLAGDIYNTVKIRKGEQLTQKERLPYTEEAERNAFLSTLSDQDKDYVENKVVALREREMEYETQVKEKEKKEKKRTGVVASKPYVRPEVETSRLLLDEVNKTQNAYTAIENMSGRPAAINQFIADTYKGITKTPTKADALPFSDVAQRKAFANSLSPEEKKQVNVGRQKLVKAIAGQKQDTPPVKATKPAKTAAPRTLEDIDELVSKKINFDDYADLSGIDFRSPGSLFGEMAAKQTPEAPSKPTTPTQFRNVVRKFLGREPENEDILITTTPRAAGMKGVPKKAMGLGQIGGKKARFFTKRIPKGEEISVFMHEVGTHVGMERLVGKTNYKYLIDKVREWGSGKGGELEVSIAKAALARIPAKTRPGARGDEAIAYFVSEAVERGISPKALAKVNSPLGTFFRYIMEGVKDILRRLGIPGYEPTTQDIVDIAYGAAQLTYKRADDVKVTLAKDEGVKESDLPQAAAFMERPVAYAVDSPSDPVGGKALINKIDSAIRAAPTSAKPALTNFRDNFEGLSRVAKKAYVSLLSVTQLAELAEFSKVPQLAQKIREISSISSVRDVAITNQKRKIEEFLLRARKITAKYKPEDVNDLYDFMHESTILGVKFDIDKRIADAQKAGNTALESKLLSDRKLMQDDQEAAGLYIKFQSFEKKFPELAKLYYELRDRYKQFSDEFLDTVNQPEVLGPAGKIINELMKKQIDPYFPLYRRGEFWVRFTDEKKREGVAAFETEGEAREFIDFAKQNKVTIDKGPYIKPTEKQLSELMPTKQVQEIIKLLNERDAPEALKESVYSIYLSLFPNQSIMQAFQRRKNRRGFRQDALANFADVGTRMAINIEQFKTVRKLDGVLKEATTMARETGTPLAEEIAVSLEKREEFLKNPVQKGVMGAMASAAGHNAYRWFILGNMSSAVINTLQLPIIVAPLLGGKFGWGEATAALREATSLYFKGGYDNNTSVISPFTKRNLSDRSFAGDKAKLSDEQKRLFENAINRGAIRRTTGQDLMEIREFGTLDPADSFSYKKMQVEMSFGWMFQNAERFNREVTLLAAYNLARKKKMSEAEATEYALSTVEFAHGAAMSELGPQAFQTGIMKVVGVFKRFALNQMYLQYKLFRQMFKGADADVRKEARNQLLGIYATSFAFAGVKGVPLYGAANILAAMIDGIFGDEDEPFDLDEWVLSTFGNGVFRGPIGAATNLNIGTRTGFGDLLWRPDEKRLADIGLLNYAMEQALGPAFGVASNLYKGATLAYEGDWQKGLETGLPSAFKSGLRAYRLATEGAVNSKGFKIIDDPNAYDVMMSAIGFSPNDLNDAYARVSIMKNIERRVQERRNGLLDALWAARQAGDYSGVRDVQQDIREFNTSKFGKVYPITSDTQERSYAMRKTREREATFGASVNPRLKQAALQEAGVLE